MNKANFFMCASWIGLAGIASPAIILLVDLDPIFGSFSLFAVWLACVVMLFTRNADEYTQALWRSGTSWAYATLLILLLGLPFAEGFYDGAQTVEMGEKGERDIPSTATIAVAILAYYVGFFVRKLRGGM